MKYLCHHKIKVSQSQVVEFRENEADFSIWQDDFVKMDESIQRNCAID